MKTTKKELELRKEKMIKEIEFIKDFAKKMGYSFFIDDYESCINNRPMKSIELKGTSDSEGYPYSWAWYVDTYEKY